MAETVVGSSVTANQLKDFFRQIADGSITGVHMQAVLEHRNPFKMSAVERITFKVTGTGLTAEKWIARLGFNGHKLSDSAHNILCASDYDARHRLEAGREYKIVLVRSTEIRKDSERTSANLKSLASREFGYQSVSDLKGEFALLIREKFANDELEQMGLTYIAVLHEPIVDHDGRPRALRSFSNADSFVGATCYDYEWGTLGAFAFLVSASD